MESPPRLGLETILGLLCQSLTWAHIPNYESGVWVRLRKVLCIQDHLVGRPPLCVAMPYLIKEFIKRALILNLNIHHALKEITHTTY